VIRRTWLCQNLDGSIRTSRLLENLDGRLKAFCLWKSKQKTEFLLDVYLSAGRLDGKQKESIKKIVNIF